MKICLFQGTFNPIHRAHIRIAEFVVNKYNFDKFIFIPAYNPPHKDSRNDYSFHRLEMVKRAVLNESKFEVSDIEYKRQGVSYTYLTICELYKLYPECDKINFIIGTDAFDKIESWYEVDKLKELVKFIVFIRDENFDVSKYDYLRQKGFDFEIQSLSFEDVSSTELRNCIKTNKSISSYVTEEVEEYIKQNGLYKD